MKILRNILIAGILFVLSISFAYAISVRPFIDLTGETSGTLDNIDISELVDGDFSFTVDSSGNLYIHRYEDSASDGEVSPWFIRPKNFATTGVWQLVTGLYLRGNLTLANSETISNGDDTEIAFNGTESIALDLNTGTANVVEWKNKTTGSTDVDTMSFAALNLVTTGKISGNIATVVENTSTTYNVTTAQAEASTFFLNTASGTKTFVLPSASAGMAVCVRNSQATSEILRIESDGTDFIVMSTGSRTSLAGDYYGATASAANQICLITFDDTDWYVSSEVGTWDEE